MASAAVATQQQPVEVRENQPFAEYHATTEEHAGSLKNLLVSPLAYYRAQRVHKPETDAMRLGSACHTAILEPDKFLRNYVLWEGGRRAGNEWKAFVEASGTKTILTDDQYALALRMRDAARNHKVAGKLLAEQGKAELSIRWTHQRTGVRIKTRLDWLCGALVDLKGTRDVSPRRFATTAAQFGYPLQLALYSDAVAAAGLGTPPVKLLAVQSVEPFDVAVYAVPEEVLCVGRDQYERALDLLLECERAKNWPGIAPDEELTLTLPAWAVPESDEELTFGGEALF